jgi:hypothetical protein
MAYNPVGNLQFNHETGFHGVVKIGTEPLANSKTPSVGDANLATILATSGSCSIEHQPIISQGVWGAGWYNAAEQVAYSNNVLKMSGSVGYELIKGKVFEAILSFGFENRAADYGHGFVILPDGQHGFVGPGWCSSVDMTASSDANVTGNIGYSSAILSRATASIGANFIFDDEKLANAREGVGAHPGVGIHGTGATGDQFLALYPFWASSVESNGSVIPNVQDWQASYSSSVEFMTLCSGYQGDGTTKGPITPDYIMVGSMSGQGSLTYIGLSSQISVDKIYAQKSYSIIVRPNSDLSNTTHWGKIDLPSVVYSNVQTQTSTGSQLVTASVSFTALGDGTKPPMSFSKYSGSTSSDSSTSTSAGE